MNLLPLHVLMTKKPPVGFVRFKTLEVDLDEKVVLRGLDPNAIEFLDVDATRTLDELFDTHMREIWPYDKRRYANNGCVVEGSTRVGELARPLVIVVPCFGN